MKHRVFLVCGRAVGEQVSQLSRDLNIAVGWRARDVLGCLAPTLRTELQNAEGYASVLARGRAICPGSF